jgi:hypothetical protein
MENQNNTGSSRGTPESAAWFRAELAEIGETQSGLARLMKRCGDDREQGNILRSIQRMAAGDARISGEMRVLLHFLRTGRRKRMEREQSAA